MARKPKKRTLETTSAPARGPKTVSALGGFRPYRSQLAQQIARTPVTRPSKPQSIGRIDRTALTGQLVDRERNALPQTKINQTRQKKVQPVTSTLDKNCKKRPANNSSKGGNARPFVKWCS